MDNQRVREKRGNSHAANSKSTNSLKLNLKHSSSSSLLNCCHCEQASVILSTPDCLYFLVALISNISAFTYEELDSLFSKLYFNSSESALKNINTKDALLDTAKKILDQPDISSWVFEKAKYLASLDQKPEDLEGNIIADLYNFLKEKLANRTAAEEARKRMENAAYQGLHNGRAYYGTGGQPMYGTMNQNTGNYYGHSPTYNQPYSYPYMANQPPGYSNGRYQNEQHGSYNFPTYGTPYRGQPAYPNVNYGPQQPYSGQNTQPHYPGSNSGHSSVTHTPYIQQPYHGSNIGQNSVNQHPYAYQSYPGPGSGSQNPNMHQPFSGYNTGRDNITPKVHIQPATSGQHQYNSMPKWNPWQQGQSEAYPNSHTMGQTQNNFYQDPNYKQAQYNTGQNQYYPAQGHSNVRQDQYSNQNNFWQYPGNAGPQHGFSPFNGPFNGIHATTTSTIATTTQTPKKKSRYDDLLNFVKQVVVKAL